jgi:SAM-dependent methyltransferase
MVDRAFAEPDLAALYDRLHPGGRREDFAFYLPWIMAADAVLDVGCGTGELLRRARELGHCGRLCGLDPADAMLDQGRAHTDIEWTLGDLNSVAWDREFDLVVMTGHAFQVLIEDDDIRAALSAIRAALTENGVFVFETRNPLVRAWETWTPDRAIEVVGPDGTAVRMAHQVEKPVVGDLVSFTTTFTSSAWDGPRQSRSTLRFLRADALASLLSHAGLAVVEQFGDWDGRPLSEDGPEIITAARRR